MEDKKIISNLEDAVTTGGCIIADATRDLRLLMSDITNGKGLENPTIIERLRDINSTLDNFYIAV